METSAENYKTAWQTHKFRYNNKDLLIQNHTRTIYELVPIIAESFGQVRQLFDTVNGHIKALQMLEAQRRFFNNNLIVHVITIKLWVKKACTNGKQYRP